MKKTETDTIQIKNHTHQKNQTNQGSDNMKEGWEIKKLKELGITQTGTTPKTSEKENYGDYIPFIKPADVDFDGNGKLRYDNEGLSVIGLSKARKIEENSIFMVCIGATIGKVGFSELESTCNQQINTLTLQKDYYPKFFYYGMTTKEFQEKVLLEGKGAQATLPIINKSKWENLTLPYPKSLPEQQRIVSILDECFAAIDKAKANAEQNLKNAKELFESYLQGVFEKGNWEKNKLQDVAKVFGRGKSKHRPRNWEGLYGGNYPFIQTGEVRNANKFIREYTQTYNEVGLAQSKLWKKGTICITIAANIAETAILDFNACIPDSIIGFEVDDKKADLNFAYYLLQYFKAELQKLGKGSAQDNINLGTFENQFFPFPPLKEQQTIVRQLDALRAETQKLEAVYQKKIADLEELKKSILQKAFAGELMSEPLINAD